MDSQHDFNLHNPNKRKNSSDLNQAGPSTSRPNDENVQAKKPKIPLSDSGLSNDSQTNNEEAAQLTGKHQPSDNHPHSSQPERDSKRPTSLVDDMEMPGTGLKHTMHGVDFQLDLLMLFLWRTRVHKLSEFRLATEQPGAEKFDDVVMFYKPNDADTLKVRLFQAKHVTGSIDRANLMSTDDKEAFVLQKYFRSLHKINKRCQEQSMYSPFSGSALEDITIITNADLNQESMEDCFVFDSDLQDDHFIGFTDIDETKKYKLRRDSAIAKELIPIFNNTSDFNMLIQLLAQSAVNKIRLDLNIPVIKEYIFALKRDVLECDNVEAKFQTEFLNSRKLSDEVKQFKDALIREVAFMKNSWDFPIPKELTFDLSNNTALSCLAVKLAAAFEKKEELKADDYPESREFLASRVVNCRTRKFRSEFITKVDLRNFRDMLKTELSKIRNVKEVTNAHLKSIEIHISGDFDEKEKGLPFDLDKLNQLADAFAGAVKPNGSVDPSSFRVLEKYQACLSKEVLDMSKGCGFNMNFVNGKLDDKGSVLPDGTMEFRRILMPKMLSENNLDEAKIFLEKDVTLPITDGLAKRLRVMARNDIPNPNEFAKQIHNILTGSANTKRHLEISANSISGASKELFEANVSTLGAECVLVETFSKIRFSTAFVEGDKFSKSISAFRTELRKLFGSDFRYKIPEYSFDIDIKAFRGNPEESITQTLPEPYEEEDFQDFFKKLRLVVNYPNRDELDNRTKKEINDHFKNLSNNAWSSQLKEHMLKWMSHVRGTFLTAKKANCMFDEINRDVLCWPLDGMNESYFSTAPSEYSFNQNLDTCVVRFLADPNNHTLCLAFNYLLLGRIRMVQTFFRLQEEDLKERQHYTRKFGHIFFKMQQFSQPNFQKAVLNRFNDEGKWNLVVVEYDDQKGGTSSFDELITALGSGGTNRKVILITRPENACIPQIIQKETVTTRFCDLDDSSQSTICQNVTISLQGSDLPANKLINDSLRHLIDEMTLHEFITDGRIEIGNDLQYSVGYDPENYIDRSLNIDKKSYNRMDNTSLDGHKTISENDLVTVDEDQKLMIISDPAGMGKTTLLSNLSKHLKSKFPNLWVFRINLNECSSFLDHEVTAREVENNPGLNPEDQNSTVTFFKKLLMLSAKFKTDFEDNLFENALKHPSELKFAILFDAFDEIRPKYSEIVLELVQGLQRTCVQKLIVTTRPSMQKRLESGLQTLVCHLRQFSKSDQETFLRKFWTKQIKSTELADFDERLGIYIAAIIKTQYDSIVSEKEEFTSNPLQLRLLAEIFEKNLEGESWQGCQEFIASSDPEPELPQRLSMFHLLKKFVWKKFMIYYQEKVRQDTTNKGFDSDKMFRRFVEQHQRLSLSLFYSSDLKPFLRPLGDCDKQMEKKDRDIARIESGEDDCGLVNRIVYGTPIFVHQTIPEYFIAEYLGASLSDKVQHKEFHEIFMRKIIFGEHMSILTVFDAWLTEGKARIPKDTKTSFGNCIIESWLNVDMDFFLIPLYSDCIEVLEFMVQCFPDEVLKELYSEDRDTMLDTACAVRNLNLIKFLLLECEPHVDAPWHEKYALRAAVDNCRVDICKWLVLTREDGGAGMHLSEEDEREMLHAAIIGGHLEVCQWLLTRGVDFNSIDEDGRKLIHKAGFEGHLHIIRWLISIGVDINESDSLGRNVLHWACQNNQRKTIDWLVQSTCSSGGGMAMDIHSEKVLTQCKLRDACVDGNLDELQYLVKGGIDLNTPDDFGSTPLLLAAEFAHENLVEWLLNKGADVKAVRKDGKAVLHLVAEAEWSKCTDVIVNHIISLALKNMDEEEASRSISSEIFATDWRGDDICLPLFQLLFKKGADITCRDEGGRTVLHYATTFRKLQTAKWLTKSEEEGGIGMEPHNIKDNYGNTVLHTAAYSGDLEMCQWLRDTMGIQKDKVNDQGITPYFYLAHKIQSPSIKREKFPSNQLPANI